MLDIQKLCVDNSIPCVDSSFRHKHTRPGWVQLNCPFCVHSPGWHLGYHLKQGYFCCYKCGFHSEIDTLAKTLHISKGQAVALAKNYRKKGYVETREKLPNAKSCVLPSGTTNLNRTAFSYLKRRRHDGNRLESLYQVQCTEHRGPLRFRIIAPFYLNGVLVSYQGRDYTGKQEPPYMGCAKALEVVPHKEMLYAEDLVPLDRIIIVEGIFDAWRIGPGAVATCGISFTAAQVKAAAKYRNRFVLFDQEEGQAREQAQELASSLSLYPGNTELIELDIEGDPDSFSQDVIDHLISELL